MDINGFDQALVESIKDARKQAGISLHRLSEMTAIPYATLHRKLERGNGSLAAKDVNSIAQALNVKGSALWPEVAA